MSIAVRRDPFGRGVNRNAYRIFDPAQGATEFTWCVEDPVNAALKMWSEG
jgi:hypothetical protein